MGFFTKTYSIKANTVGLLYKENKFIKQYDPGYYTIFDLYNRTEMFVFSTVPKMISAVNQEVLTQDNIALRCSVVVIYQIKEPQKLIEYCSLDRGALSLTFELEQRIINTIQMSLRDKVASVSSEILSQKRNEIQNLKTSEIESEFMNLGIEVQKAEIKDITYPKNIQNLFSHILEAKIRTQSDLENARTAIAVARSLKNAAEIIKDNENIKFFQWLEALQKISQKGSHTFVVGDINKTLQQN